MSFFAWLQSCVIKIGYSYIPFTVRHKVKESSNGLDLSVTWFF